MTIRTSICSVLAPCQEPDPLRFRVGETLDLDIRSPIPDGKKFESYDLNGMALELADGALYEGHAPETNYRLGYDPVHLNGAGGHEIKRRVTFFGVITLKDGTRISAVVSVRVDSTIRSSERTFTMFITDPVLVSVDDTVVHDDIDAKFFGEQPEYKALFSLRTVYTEG